MQHGVAGYLKNRIPAVGEHVYINNAFNVFYGRVGVVGEVDPETQLFDVTIPELNISGKFGRWELWWDHGH